MMKYLLDAGCENKWQINVCLECKKEFKVRTCYVKRGQGKFCSIGCGTTHRNKINNPTNDAKVRQKISKNHIDVSGKNNPMYGKRGKLAPSYIDGRSEVKGDIWRKIALGRLQKCNCEICNNEVKGRKLHIHHKDKNRKNNLKTNLQIVCAKCHNNILHKRMRNNIGQFISGGLA